LAPHFRVDNHIRRIRRISIGNTHVVQKHLANRCRLDNMRIGTGVRLMRQGSFKRLWNSDGDRANKAAIVGATMSSIVENSLPIKLKLDKKFQPPISEDGDELYANGIFLFNISRLLAFINVHPERFQIVPIEIDEVPHYCEGRLDHDAILGANLSRPIVLAEISPDNYNLIDGNHRVARAKRDGIRILPGWRVRCTDHVDFLTSTEAYEKYVEYWNGKVKQLRRGA
jgi:hypothetical protein